MGPTYAGPAARIRNAAWILTDAEPPQPAREHVGQQVFVRLVHQFGDDSEGAVRRERRQRVRLDEPRLAALVPAKIGTGKISALQIVVDAEGEGVQSGFEGVVER